jgi:hypothetical protein
VFLTRSHEHFIADDDLRSNSARDADLRLDEPLQPIPTTASSLLIAIAPPQRATQISGSTNFFSRSQPPLHRF